MAPDRKASVGALQCAAAASIAAAAAVGLAVLIVWIVVRPAPLEFSVDDAIIRGLNFTAGKLSASFHISLWADNRNNKVGVYYDAMQVSVIYLDQQVAMEEIPPFFQSHHNATEIPVMASAREVVLGEEARREMKREKEEGKIVVQVVVRAWIRFRIASFRSRHYTLRAQCGPLDLYVLPGRPSNRTDCAVDI